MTTSIRLERIPEWRSPDDPSGDPVRVVVKVRGGPGAWRLAFAEAAALSSIEHRHVVRILDLVAVGDDVGIVLPELSSTTAAEWLDSRGSVTAGEAVTLLVPLLRVLLHLDRRGFDPRLDFASSVRLDNVLFDDTGAPMAVGLRAVDHHPSESSATGPAAGLPSPGAVIAGRLIHHVLQRTRGGADTTRKALDGLIARGASLDELIEVVFELDEAVPLEDPLGDPRSAVTTGDRLPGDPTVSMSHEDTQAVHPLDSLLPGFSLLRSIVTRSRSLESLVAALRQVRPAVWATSTLVVASAMVGGIVLGGDPDGPASPLATTPTANRTPSPTVTTVPPTVQPTLTSPPAEVGAAPTTQQSSSSDTAAILTGDDADRAAGLLLELRASCLAALDSECLGAVDQPDSPALRADLAAIADPTLLDALPVDLVIANVVNRVGGSVLYAATADNEQPASVLIARTQAGWRVRSVN